MPPWRSPARLRDPDSSEPLLMCAAAGLRNAARDGPRQPAIVAFSDCSGFVRQRLCSGIAHLGRSACDAVELAFHLSPWPVHVLHPSASVRAVKSCMLPGIQYLIDELHDGVSHRISDPYSRTEGSLRSCVKELWCRCCAIANSLCVGAN